MSIINKMLQDLDKRHATAEPAADPASAGSLAQQARPVRARSVGSNLFWRVMAGVMAVVVAWVIWVLWQIMPSSVATDLAYQSLAKARSAPPAAASAPAAPTSDAQQAAVAPQQAAGPAPAAPVAVPAAAPATASAVPSPVPKTRPMIDMLHLATEMATPIPGTKAVPAPRSPEERNVAKISPVPKDARAAKAAAKSEQPAPKARAGLIVAPEEVRIDKRVDVTPRERAESEFRRAMSLVNQGRMAEGMDGLKSALGADASYELARQTLVALLLEAKRTDEAAALLQEGLAVNAANVGYAMLLARIVVERGDPNGALALLQKSGAAARSNAEYQAFVAALYQRLGRHTEAVERYQGALRLSAGVGAWWVGLGISQEALLRPQDATESFQRAKGTGSLSPELLAYVERRLKQLQ
jgi:MSHA biogenesis protein MshN